MEIRSDGTPTYDKKQGSEQPEQVPAAFDAAVNAGDLDAVVGLFSAYATMRMTSGEIVQKSRAELRSHLAELLAVRPRIRNDERRVLVGDDIALILLDWTLTATLPDGRPHEERGTATQVMSKGADGGWKLRISNPLGLN